MDRDTYKIVGKFKCCGVTMVSVIIKGKAACVMPEREYNGIIIREREFRKRMLEVA